MANRHRKEKLELCRGLLSPPATELLPDRPQCTAALAAIVPAPLHRCPVCGAGEMVRMVELPPYCWPAQPPDTS